MQLYGWCSSFNHCQTLSQKHQPDSVISLNEFVQAELTMCHKFDETDVIHKIQFVRKN